MVRHAVSLGFSLWTTVESLAWSQGAEYDEYLSLHHKAQQKGEVVTEDGYQQLCHFFDDEMARTFQLQKLQKKA